MMEIKKVSETVTGHGNFILYGPSGVGKTYSATTLPGKTLILSAEKGLRTLVELVPDMDVADINCIAEMREAHTFLKTSSDYQMVFIDSLSELGEMALNEAKATTKDGRQAYMLMADTIAAMIIAFNSLPMTVIFTAQEERIASELMGQVDYLYAPSIPGKSFMAKVPYKLDFVFCLRSRINGEGVIERTFQTGPNGDYLAKARSQRLETFESPDWGNIFKKLNTIKGA
jgi:phage nucleotide-binding protein